MRASFRSSFVQVKIVHPYQYIGMIVRIGRLIERRVRGGLYLLICMKSIVPYPCRVHNTRYMVYQNRVSRIFAVGWAGLALFHDERIACGNDGAGS